MSITHFTTSEFYLTEYLNYEYAPSRYRLCYNLINMNNNFDAIVIGAGMSGGWVSKELCDGGIKTLMLERGPNIEHIRLSNYEYDALGTQTQGAKLIQNQN